jgi:hypothetical protein
LVLTRAELGELHPPDPCHHGANRRLAAARFATCPNYPICHGDVGVMAALSRDAPGARGSLRWLAGKQAPWQEVRVLAALGEREAAVAKLRDALTEGPILEHLGWHTLPEVRSLWSYRPFLKLAAPRDARNEQALSALPLWRSLGGDSLGSSRGEAPTCR